MTAKHKADHSRGKELWKRAKKMHDSDAFEPVHSNVGGDVDQSAVRAAMKADAAKTRKVIIIFCVAMVAVAVFSLFIPFYTMDNVAHEKMLCSLSAVLSAYKLWFQIHVIPLFDATYSSKSAALLLAYTEQYGTVYEPLMLRFAVSFTIIACGFMLAVSGLLFQSTFRNPLAVPTMLGVSDGVSIGSIIFVTIGYSFFEEAPGIYYLLAYGTGVVTLLVVLALSFVMSGRRNFSIFNMLLVGTVITQLLGGLVNYYSNFLVDADTWTHFYQLQQGLDTLREPATYVVVLVVFVVTLIPTYALRFRLNLVAYDDSYQRMLGARPKALRAVAMILGSVMQLAAIASIGQVAMISLAVPFLTRYAFRNDFRQQLLGNFLLGALVLLICEALQSFCVVSGGDGSMVMPLGTIISFVIMPFFVWMLALNKRGWE